MSRQPKPRRSSLWRRLWNRLRGRKKPAALDPSLVVRLAAERLQGVERIRACCSQRHETQDPLLVCHHCGAVLCLGSDEHGCAIILDDPAFTEKDERAAVHCKACAQRDAQHRERRNLASRVRWSYNQLLYEHEQKAAQRRAARQARAARRRAAAQSQSSPGGEPQARADSAASVPACRGEEDGKPAAPQEEGGERPARIASFLTRGAALLGAAESAASWIAERRSATDEERSPDQSA